MSKTHDGGTAFPMQDSQAIHAYAIAKVEGITDTAERDRVYTLARAEAVGGMTLRQYAAIKLRVPDSGTDWLDDMIRQSLRDEMAAKAMAALIASRNTESDHGEYDEGTVAESAYAMADALLAAREL